MGFGKLVKSVSNRLIARDNVNEVIATSALTTSKGALNAIQHGGKKNAKAMSSIMPALTGANVSNQQKLNVVRALASVEHDTETLEYLAPYVKRSAQAWDKGAKLRHTMAQDVAKAGQSVAVGNTKAQAAISKGQNQAVIATEYERSVYNHAGFAA